MLQRQGGREGGREGGRKGEIKCCGIFWEHMEGGGLTLSLKSAEFCSIALW